MNPSRRVYSSILFLVSLWCSLILAAPLLQSLSPQTQPIAMLLYRLFARICHQMPERSFHLNDHPWAVCIRCSSIYVGFLLGLLSVPFLRGISFRHAPPREVLFLCCLPMLVDVTLNVVGIHESTMWTRLVTGLLVGIIAPFYFLPPLLEAITQRFPRWTSVKGEPRYARKTE